MSPVKAKLKHRCMFPKFYFTIFPCPQITACDSTLTIEGDMMPKPTIIRPCKPDKKPLKTNIAVTSNEATIKFHCGGSGDECNLELHWEAIEKSSAVRCNELSFWHCYSKKLILSEVFEQDPERQLAASEALLPRDEDDYIDPHFGEIPPKFDVLQEEEGIYSQALRYILKQEKICHILRGLPRFQ